MSEMKPRVERELAKLKQDKGKRHVDTIRCVLRLANLNNTIAHFEEAEALTREALGVLEADDELEGVKDEQRDRARLTAHTLNNLGRFLQEQGRLCELDNSLVVICYALLTEGLISH